MNNPLLAIQVSLVCGENQEVRADASPTEPVLGSQGLSLSSECHHDHLMLHTLELIHVSRQVLRESKFKQHGKITPEEFVAAGDFLTYKFPVWTWQKGDASRARDFLPGDKQYLVTRNVACLRRAEAVEYGDDEQDGERLVDLLNDAEEAVPGDEWVETHVGRVSGGKRGLDEIPDMDDEVDRLPSPKVTSSDTPRVGDLTADIINKLNFESDNDTMPNMDDIPDMDDDGDDAIGGEGVMLEEAQDDAAAAAPKTTLVHPTTSDLASAHTPANLLQVRTYDCFISYDKHYQTPRFWLLGYDENKQPLTPTQVFQDVPSDHAFKTMTMETFPHSGQLMASVHPCKHASVMKKFIDRMDGATSGQQQQAQEEVAPTAASTDKKKKGWGLGGVVKRVTGSTSATPSTPIAQDDSVSGVQVDFYMVIVSRFASEEWLLHTAYISASNPSSSNSLPALSPPLKSIVRLRSSHVLSLYCVMTPILYHYHVTFCAS